MNDVPLGPYELKEIRGRIRKSVNSLELCEVCERICECEQWLVNDVQVWVCIECLPRDLSRLKKTAGDSGLSP
jgi:hypothetical protein